MGCERPILRDFQRGLTSCLGKNIWLDLCFLKSRTAVFKHIQKPVWDSMGCEKPIFRDFQRGLTSCLGQNIWLDLCFLKRRRGVFEHMKKPVWD